MAARLFRYEEAIGLLVKELIASWFVVCAGELAAQNFAEIDGDAGFFGSEVIEQ